MTLLALAHSHQLHGARSEWLQVFEITKGFRAERDPLRHNLRTARAKRPRVIVT